MSRLSPPLLLTSFGRLELLNALSLQVFRKRASASKTAEAIALLASDIQGGIFLPVALSEMTYDRAEQLARRRTPHLGTRTLDVLHVASALVLQAEAFYTFDHGQKLLAKSEGLFVP
jgi:predicted nucleic acid-binding protein